MGLPGRSASSRCEKPYTGAASWPLRTTFPREKQGEACALHS